MHIDWCWIVLGAIIVTAATVFDLEGRVFRRRLLAGLLVLWGAGSLASFAIFGPGKGQADLMRLSENARLAFRFVVGVGALWAAYLGVDMLRTWWRIGDRPEE